MKITDTYVVYKKTAVNTEYPIDDMVFATKDEAAAFLEGLKKDKKAMFDEATMLLRVGTLREYIADIYASHNAQLDRPRMIKPRALNIDLLARQSNWDDL